MIKTKNFLPVLLSSPVRYANRTEFSDKLRLVPCLLLYIAIHYHILPVCSGSVCGAGYLTDNWATTAYGHAPAMAREIAGIEKYVRVTAQDREQVGLYFCIEQQFLINITIYCTRNLRHNRRITIRIVCTDFKDIRACLTMLLTVLIFHGEYQIMIWQTGMVA